MYIYDIAYLYLDTDNDVNRAIHRTQKEKPYAQYLVQSLG